MRGIVRLTLPLGLLLLAGCDFNETKKTDLTPAPTNQPAGQPAFARLQTSLFDAYCVSCHSATEHQGGVTLTSYTDVMGSKAMGGSTPIVHPGQATASALYLQVSSGAMPPKGAKPDAATAKLLQQWIDGGAGETTLVAAESLDALPLGAPPPRVVTFKMIQNELFNMTGNPYHCVMCHGPVKPQAGVRLDTYDGVKAKVTPHDPDSSQLYLEISTHDMPPDGSGQPAVANDVIADLASWIRRGAPHD
jgi:hypothetical protein